MTGSSKRENLLQVYRCLPFVFLFVVLALVVYARIRLLELPLERDEGEYAYIGQLLLKGIAPYTQAYSMKPPGVAAMYALIMSVFGQSAYAIHLGLLIVNIISVGLVYLLGKRLIDSNAAIFACASYALLSFSQSIMGVAAHATHFINMLILLGLVQLLQEVGRLRSLRIFMAGTCFGLAIVMKQHAVMLCLFVILYFVWADRQRLAFKTLLAKGGLIILGIITPYSILAIACVMAGVFNDFWFWTIEYASNYASALSPFDGIYYLTRASAIILSVQFPLVAFAIMGLGFVLLNKKQTIPAGRFIGLFLLVSFLSICPGFYFRPHYFVLLLPAVALLIGYAANSCNALFPADVKVFRRLLVSIIPMLLIIWGIYNERQYFFILSPAKVSQKLYGNNPFPEAIEIASYIKRHTLPGDRIAVLGSEPEIYFYANRLSATGHIYMYGLMENHPDAESMQIQMIREITAGMPAYIVKADIQYSWLVQQGAPQLLFNWMDNYLKQNYQVKGVVDMLDSDSTRYVWDGEAEGYMPRSESFLTIYKRKDGA